MSLEALIAAVARKDVAAVEEALRSGVPVDAAHDGETPLMKAVAIGAAKIAEALIAHGANVHARDRGGWTPLHHATSGSAKAVAVLVDAGAQVDARDQHDVTPLLSAVARNNSKVALALLERDASATVADALGFTALHYAASFGDTAMVQALLDAGAPAAETSRAAQPAYRWKKGATAAAIAKQAGKKDVQALLDAAAGCVPPTLDEVMKRVEAQCLGGERAPVALRGLWAARLADRDLIDDPRYGEVELLESRDELEDELATFTEPSMQRRLRELWFFGREADGGFLALWKHQETVPLAEAPVVVLDSEGALWLSAPTIEDHFAVRARDDKSGGASRELAALYEAFGIPAPCSAAATAHELEALPDPEVA